MIERLKVPCPVKEGEMVALSGVSNCSSYILAETNTLTSLSISRNCTTDFKIALGISRYEVKTVTSKTEEDDNTCLVKEFDSSERQLNAEVSPEITKDKDRQFITLTVLKGFVGVEDLDVYISLESNVQENNEDLVDEIISNQHEISESCNGDENDFSEYDRVMAAWEAKFSEHESDEDSDAELDDLVAGVNDAPLMLEYESSVGQHRMVQQLVNRRNVPEIEDVEPADESVSQIDSMTNVEEEIVEQNTALERGTCVVCFDKAASQVFFPCGHAKTCLKCTREVVRTTNLCPICRAHIHAHAPLYL